MSFLVIIQELAHMVVEAWSFSNDNVVFQTICLQDWVHIYVYSHTTL